MAPPSVTFVPSKTLTEALQRAAALWRIDAGYWDIWGKYHETRSEVQRAILQSLGVPCESTEAVDGAMEDRLWREWSRLVPPALVLSENIRPRAFPLSLPASLAHGSAAVEIRWEEGRVERYEVKLGELPDESTAELRGQSFVRKAAPLPETLRLGYHEVEVSIAGEEERRGTARLIVTPDRAWLPPQLRGTGRAGGVCVSLYSVRSARNWGCGDFTDLKSVIDWVVEDTGCSFLGLNPLHAIPNRQPYNTSPYLPASIYFLNPLYIDMEQVEDFQESEEARRLFRSPEVQAEMEELRATGLVEYERVYALKLRFLRLAFDTFVARLPEGSSRREAFRKYCEEEGELLEKYALWCGLDEWMHARDPDVWIWPQWPEEYREPESPAVREFAEQNRSLIEFHKYLQWEAERQLMGAHEHARRKGLSIGLYHDLALATDRCGADLWGHRPFYVSGCRVGSPPDDFSPDGQDWAFPPPNAERHRETGYRLFVESIRRNCRHGGALRIDHVMRFFRLFWIPDGMPASEGTYVRDYHEDLLRILSLESVRHKVLVVGEDLGTVEPEIRDVLGRHGILSYRLFYFEKDKKGAFLPPHRYPRQALVSATTHDLPTLAGFWLSRDIEARRSAGILDDAAFQSQLEDRAKEKGKMLKLLLQLRLLPGELSQKAAELTELSEDLHQAFVGFLASTPSMLMALNQEDIFQEAEQQNLPGTTWEHPNWRRKMRFSVEELSSAGRARDCTAKFRRWLEKTRRLPSSE